MHAFLVLTILAALLGIGCERAGNPGAALEADPATSTSVVAIPEEFQSSAAQTPAPELPATPRILFAVKSFQVKTESGIQGIMAGETVNVIREVKDAIVVQYGDVEFARPKSFFSATFVGESSSTPRQGHRAMNQEGVDAIELTARVPAREPGLPGENLPEMPARVPRLSSAEKKLAELTDSIRALNANIRTAQENAEHFGKVPTRTEKRAIDQMKSDRDELSRRLTTLGKP
jgi:hypothetical protein